MLFYIPGENHACHVYCLCNGVCIRHWQINHPSGMLGALLKKGHMSSLVPISNEDGDTGFIFLVLI